jgi:hypothetical protein
MTNHLHIVVIAWDAEQCNKFHGEIKKQLTDAVKRFLGKERLSLWKENGTSVVEYEELAAVQHRIAYMYANPARADMVSTIGKYPGLSSWRDFKRCTNAIDSKSSRSYPWIRLKAIEKLPSKALTPKQDRQYTARLKDSAKLSHELVVEPNAWMKVFGVQSEAEVAGVNEGIIEQLKDFEYSAARERKEKGKQVIGALKLSQASIDLSYRPKSHGRRIFVYALDTEIRISMIESYKAFCERCTECYLRWKLGDYSVEWPPGAFKPAEPRRMNYLWV